MKTNMNTTINDTRLSPHFRLGEFINLHKYPDNKPTMQHVANMTYGCLMLLEPARQVVGPIIINSGYRNPRVNALVGGVRNSQHLAIQVEICPFYICHLQKISTILTNGGES